MASGQARIDINNIARGALHHFSSGGTGGAVATALALPVRAKATSCRNWHSSRTRLSRSGRLRLA